MASGGYFSKKLVLKLPALLILLLLSARGRAQSPFDIQQLKADTSPKLQRQYARHLFNRKNFGRAALELGAAEVLPWVWDRYLKNADYAKISFKTVGQHLNPSSWAWDDDNFQTNQFGHPYHGSFFFSTFRTNGYSFWQSAPAAVVGSYIWETAAENQAPAPNDFINTSFGGIVLGEMTYRLSNKIINNRSRGFKRQASEVLALLINPVNGLNRIIDGKWGKVMNNAPYYDSSRVSAEFDLGMRSFKVNSNNPLKNGHYGWYGHIKLQYGTPYQDFKRPFTNIAVNAEFGQDDSSKVNVVSAYGSLTGWKIYTEKIKNLAILSANYDYIRNAAFFYGAQSVKMNLYSEAVLSAKIKVNTSLGAGPVILAAVPDPYLHDNNRNYDYGPGFAVNGSAGIGISNNIFYNFNYRGGWLETINGNPSHYFLYAYTNELVFRVVKRFLLGAESGNFTLHGDFKNYAEVNRTYPYLRISARYTTSL
jgi:hypothetical protein